MRLSPTVLLLTAIVVATPTARTAERRCVSGVYPHLAMYNTEGECGTGAVVPWAERLWVITYGPHRIKGSSDRLYEITPELEQIVRPESLGGTHANRMIHRESQQLFIGYHAIDATGNVRTIPWEVMPGRLTGAARHLTDPASMIYMATMEEGLYEINVNTLAVTELIRDGNIRNTSGLDLPADAIRSKLPGYHGKGLFSGQGRLVYSNNGEHGGKAQRDPTTVSGALAEWRGKGDWQLVRRNQFTAVRGPGDLSGNVNVDTDPLWALGWDHRSLLLVLLDNGTWHTYRLPKASHSYDGAHGWNTEWPRIRDIGEQDMLATMHGTFWRFPKTFSRRSSAGVSPRSNYLKVVGDFCRWRDRIVLGCDDSAQKEFLNTRPFKSRHGAPGQSNSNLWFIAPERLDRLGPALGRGAVWLREDVAADTPSDPYLFDGYDHRMVTLSHTTDNAVTFIFEIDRHGNAQWSGLRRLTVPAHGSEHHVFDTDARGAWVRVRTDRAATGVSVHFQHSNRGDRPHQAAPLFADIARVGADAAVGGIMRCLGENRRALGLVAVDLANGKELGYYELDANLNLRRSDDPGGMAAVLAATPPAEVISADAASLILTEDGKRFRLPANPAYSTAPAEAAKAEPAAAEDEQPNLALRAAVTVSSTHADYAAAHAVDGRVTEESRWVSKPEGGRKWITLDLGVERSLASARIISGYNRGPGTMVTNATLQMQQDEEWVDIPGARISGNREVTCTINFARPVTTRRVRLVATDGHYVRIYELELYAKPRADVTAAADLTVARVCREIATERDLVNCHGTFYELPARNAGGLPKIRPVATHGLAIHDYVSYRGMFVLTGIDPERFATANEHVAVSDDGKCAVWCGAIDDLWELGKPRGEGGPWRDTAVEAGVPSDPYLMTGYDRKTVTLTHSSDAPVTFTVEFDPDGTALWCRYRKFAVQPGQSLTHTFPEGFNAYWVRVTVDQATTATAWLKYE